ncbi:hypothetical protein J437_LFUL004175 [Ladona fulva]|uniref:Uncharacterized protein n=1 Tax=Ladona fulva TaxID=123851 RepID=A0A8K0NXR5_LADFU|nr:hypothetical protein J437_LFUL004175 [Ladona fulva]
MKDLLSVAHKYRMPTYHNALVKDAEWYCLQDTMHRKLGREVPTPSNQILEQYMSGSMEGHLGLNNGSPQPQPKMRRSCTSLILVPVTLKGGPCRHNEIQNILLNSLPSTFTVRTDHHIPGEDSLLWPYIYTAEGPRGPFYIIDITVPFDNRPISQSGQNREILLPHQCLWVQQEYKAEFHLGTLVVGSLGSWPPENEKLLGRL